MSKRESFLLRIDPAILDELKRWAESELRSTNSHIEYLLRQCLIDAGRKHASVAKNEKATAENPEGSDAPEENG